MVLKSDWNQTEGCTLSQSGTKTPPAFDPYAVHERLAFRKQMEDAEQLCNTLVLDEDGSWLRMEIAKVRKLSRPQFGTIGSTIDMARTFRFRSKMPLHNMDEGHEADYYSEITMPLGFQVLKIGGTSFKSWTFRVANGLKDENEEHIHLKYDCDQRLYMVRHYHAVRDSRSGRRAAQRSRGHGPDRSL